MTDNEELKSGESADDDGAMSLIEHLEELRWRLIKMIAAVTVTSTISYFFVEDFIRLITSPVGKLYYMNPTEAFFAYIKVSIFVGFLFALPVVMHQVWAFTVPALTQNERQAGIYLVPSSLLFFFLGLAFSYFLVLPVGIRFFMGFATENLQPLFSLGDYITFVITFLLPFGLVFELPLVILVLAKFGIIDSEYLVAKRKHVLVMSFVI
ncbi:MAG: twin-arginine translocase subunit TatC, partial [Sporomusaceae bacterium]|nr:twin-arginine translocase subunit TatC [Sporomusaceae bacterium]